MIFLVLPDYDYEDDLLRRMRRNDQQVILDIYEQYFPAVYHYIRLKVQDKMLAEDLAGDVFLLLVQTYQSKKIPHTSLRGWLFKVAHNLIAKHHRVNQNMENVDLEEWFEHAHDVEAKIIHNINIKQVLQALKMLVPEQQEVIILRFGQMLSLQETADIMDKSVGAIKSLQFRAIDTIRQILGIGERELATHE